MRKSWEPKKCEVFQIKTEHEEHKQILAQYAELIYGQICQFRQNQKANSASSVVPVVQPLTKRTGTDG